MSDARTRLEAFSAENPITAQKIGATALAEDKADLESERYAKYRLAKQEAKT